MVKSLWQKFFIQLFFDSVLNDICILQIIARSKEVSVRLLSYLLWGILRGFLRSGFSQKTRFYKIRSGIFKWVFKSAICRKLWLNKNTLGIYIFVQTARKDPFNASGHVVRHFHEKKRCVRKMKHSELANNFRGIILGWVTIDLNLGSLKSQFQNFSS